MTQKPGESPRTFLWTRRPSKSVGLNLEPAALLWPVVQWSRHVTGDKHMRPCFWWMSTGPGYGTITCDWPRTLSQSHWPVSTCLGDPHESRDCMSLITSLSLQLWPLPFLLRQWLSYLRVHLWELLGGIVQMQFLVSIPRKYYLIALETPGNAHFCTGCRESWCRCLKPTLWESVTIGAVILFEPHWHPRIQGLR